MAATLKKVFIVTSHGLRTSLKGPASKYFVLKAVAVSTVVLALTAASSCPRTSQTPIMAPTPDFATISKLMNDAIAAHRLPGAVVIVGHDGTLVFHRAYGLRKLAGEPGLDGSPAPAEPMTEDTVFDMASLTKCLATATAIMQLYEQGRLRFDDPVQRYLPDFNAANDPQRAKVTVRMLLTHTSGEATDVSLKDPWGLDRPDKAEGIHRALTMRLKSGPGELFRYADINFILLGALIEKVTGEAEDVYVQQNIFAPLGMQDTGYLPMAKACGFSECLAGAGSVDVLSRIAPTTHDDESRNDPSKNPDYGRLLRGVAHDPTARRMGGVAGHAGVFSTALDISIYAQALLDRLAGRPSNFPLKQATLKLMTTPQQPGHTTRQLEAANRATREAIAKTPNEAYPLLAPSYPAIRGQNLRGFGWDIDTDHSVPRGRIFPIGSFGHTGFTGTTLWIDPSSDTYVILLSNAVHPRGNPPISDLRGAVATAAAQALRL